jgi:hypothetical protein
MKYFLRCARRIFDRSTPSTLNRAYVIRAIVAIKICDANDAHN